MHRAHDDDKTGLSVALTLPASLPLPLTATRAVPLPVLVLRVLPLLGVATLAALALAEAVIAVPVPVGSLHANDGGCAPADSNGAWRAPYGSLGSSWSV